jgi:hypothetical protein
MLVFLALIVTRWFGWQPPGMGEAEILEVWALVKMGLGGYVVGRSAEKTAPVVANIIKGALR